MPDDLVGQVLLDSYRITGLLGRGGMGAVYEAQHLRLPKKVAVKVLHPDASDNPELFLRFRREAEVASALGNSHICEVADFSPPRAPFPFIVMEFLDGVDLAAYMEQKGPLPLKQAVRISQEVLSALDAAHARDIVHRDLKPQNIYLCRRDRREDFVKLLDFGISKMKTGGSALTKPLAVLGTPSYMAPEQVQGRPDLIDARTDLWGMGVVLYEMLTGRVAFPGHDMLSAVYRVVFEEPPPITAVRRDVPAAVCAVVARAMSKKREERYPSAQAMEEELTRAAQATGEWEKEEDTAPDLVPTATRPAFLRPTATLRGRAVAPEPPAPALAPTRDAAPVAPAAALLAVEPDEPPTLRRRPVAAVAAAVRGGLLATMTAPRPVAAVAAPAPEAQTRPRSRNMTLASGIAAVTTTTMRAMLHARRQLVLPVALVLVMAGLGGVVATVVLSTRPPPRAVVEAPAPAFPQTAPDAAPSARVPTGTADGGAVAAAPASSPTPAPPAPVALRVRVLPERAAGRARILWDGTLVSDNPLRVPFSRVKHRLTVEAVGFTPETVEVTPDRTQEVGVRLHRERHGGMPAPARVPSAAPAPAPARARAQSPPVAPPKPAPPRAKAPPAPRPEIRIKKELE